MAGEKKNLSRARWKLEIVERERKERERREAIEKAASDAKKLVDAQAGVMIAKGDPVDKSTVMDGLVEKHPMLRAQISRRLRKVSTQGEMRSLLMACTTEEELVKTKDVIMDIALDPGHKDCLRAITLIWAYVLGKPEMDLRIENRNITEKTPEEKRAMLIAVLKRDPAFRDVDFQKMLAGALDGRKEAGNDLGGHRADNPVLPEVPQVPEE